MILSAKVLMVGSLVSLVFGAVAFSRSAGEKRIILTSGEKVQVIHYQLGQSTVLYLGLKPETVICGNKNYFNIEKIKQGLTIQPLSNFSTNLTVMGEGKRFLFFLTPVKSGTPDTFVDVQFIPRSETREIPKTIPPLQIEMQILSGATSLGPLKITMKKLIQQANGCSILEFTVANLSSVLLPTSAIGVLLVQGLNQIEGQTLVFGTEKIPPKSESVARVITRSPLSRGAEIAISVEGQSRKIPLGLPTRKKN